MDRPAGRSISKLSKSQVQRLEALRDTGETTRITNPTTVVVDNSPLHTSGAIQAMIPKWEKQNLCLWFLPAY